MVIYFPQVRASMYSIVPGMCHKLPEFVQLKGKLLCSAVLGSLGESDPQVVGAVWEAALMILAKTEVCWGCGWLGGRVGEGFDQVFVK